MEKCLKVAPADHAGFEASHGIQAETITMCQVYDERLDKIEKARIEKLEIFDEFEEWILIQNHYCICIGKRFAKEPDIESLAAQVKIQNS